MCAVAWPWLENIAVVGQRALAAEHLVVRDCGCQRQGGTLLSMVPAAKRHHEPLWWRMVGGLVGAEPAPADGGGGEGRFGEVVDDWGDGQLGCPRWLCAAMNAACVLELG